MSSLLKFTIGAIAGATFSAVFFLKPKINRGKPTEYEPLANVFERHQQSLQQQAELDNQEDDDFHYTPLYFPTHRLANGNEVVYCDNVYD